MKYIPLAARICLSLIFIYGSVNNITGFAQTLQGLQEMGLPIPILLLLGNIVFQIFGVISLLLGWKIRLGAIALIVFLIPTTLVFHAFWNDPSELIPFLKNVGLIGGVVDGYLCRCGCFKRGWRKQNPLKRRRNRSPKEISPIARGNL